MVFRDDALRGQHVFISGGAGAIGVAIVRRLTEHGAHVTVNDVIDEKSIRAALAEDGVMPDRVLALSGDLTHKPTVMRLINRAREHFGPLDVVCCHAGIVRSGPLITVDEADWDQTIDVNLKAAFLLAQAGANAMLADGQAGQLIFTTSWVGAVPWPEIGPYSASKAGMNMLMRTFARELAPQGIRANGVAPGIVGVGMARRQWDTEPEYRARASRAIPLGALQTPESVADAFLFLCSPLAAYMTGSVLLVDGGCSLYPMD
jgi:NAD(P)-dependent dehydrogenase (short-subunit alcohol dehydrogenase family)